MNKGCIKISNGLYINDYHSIKNIFKDFIPTYIEFRYWENDMWYLYGESEQFEELIEGQKIPIYYIEQQEDSNGEISFKFTKA